MSIETGVDLWYWCRLRLIAGSVDAFTVTCTNTTNGYLAQLKLWPYLTDQKVFHLHEI